MLQKTIQKKEDTIKTKPKPNKKRRSKNQLDCVRKKGERITRIAGAIIALSGIKWNVASQTVRGLQYVVTLSSLGLICSCPANAGGLMICKHVFAVHRNMICKWWREKRKRIQINRQKVRCRTPRCRSEIVCNGKRRCKRKGTVQRYLCKSCGCTFSGIEGFVGRHFPESVIVRTISMVAAKMSPAEACNQLKLEGISIHPTTVSHWVSDYSSIMYNFSSRLRIDAGHMWHVDEIHFKVLKKARYLFAVMDSESRFILAHRTSKDKQGVKPTGLFRAAASCSMRLPRILVSDGLPDFGAPARKVFHRMSGPRFVHICEIHLRNIFNQNNIYERLNGEYKDRLKCIRGLKSENPAIISMIIVYHNFFRGHTALDNNMTPAEAIGIDIVPVADSELAPECDRWITLIQNAAIHMAA